MENQNQTNIFGLDFEAEENLFNNVQQVELLSEMLSKNLFEQIRAKGYEPFGKVKIIPYTDIDKTMPKNRYRMTVKAKQVKGDKNNDT